MSSRVYQLFGVAAPWILKPQRSALLCASIWMLSLPLTWQHPFLSLLAFTAIWGLTLALTLEAPLLESFPLPPLTVLLIGLCLRWGLGPLFLSIGGSGGDPFLDIWVRYGPQSQLLWFSLTASLLVLANSQKQAVANTAKSQPQSSWLVEANRNPRFRTQLSILAFVLSIYMASYIVLSILSGAFDRQIDNYISWVQQLWRLDTPVAAFSRLRDIWFFLFPLWWRLLSRPWRWLLGTEMLAFFSASLLSGSRGLLFYPAVLFMSGLWLVLRDTRSLRRFGLMLATLVLIFSPLISAVRDNPLFHQNDSWTARLHALGSTLTKIQPIKSKVRWLGRDLYACHDPYLFKPDNNLKSSVGSSGLSSLIYLWVPKHLFPEQPVIFDVHLIAKKMQGVREDMFWFPCLSLPADLFRRWALPGIFLGSLVVGVCVNVLLRLWYHNVSTSGSTYQLLLMLLPVTYLQSFPFGTVSETSWYLFWELPKYLLLFFFFGFFVDRFLDRSSP